MIENIGCLFPFFSFDNLTAMELDDFINWHNRALAKHEREKQ